MASVRSMALWAIPAATALGILGWFLATPPPAVPPRSAPSTADTKRSNAPHSATGGAPRRAASEDEPLQPGDEAGGAAALPRYDGPVRDRARADRLREALMAVVASAHGGSGPGAMPAPVGDGNQADQALGAYVGSVMSEQFVPLAGSCYEALLERVPEARGNVVLDFSILGDRSVGGVVVDVSAKVDGTLPGEEFGTCMRESMLAVVFDAPPDGHASVTVKQSFELAP